MSTKVYGTSDDLIEVEGDISGEVGCYGTHDRDQGVLLVFSDGTLLEAKYGKGGEGVWAVTPIVKGSLFANHEPCVDPDATPYSDVVTFNEGLKWAYAATEWQRVK